LAALLEHCHAGGQHLLLADLQQMGKDFTEAKCEAERSLKRNNICKLNALRDLLLWAY
jgi:hypothetical protein